jgi:hypothetical protein
MLNVRNAPRFLIDWPCTVKVLKPNLAKPVLCRVSELSADEMVIRCEARLSAKARRVEIRTGNVVVAGELRARRYAGDGQWEMQVRI